MNPYAPPNAPLEADTSNAELIYAGFWRRFGAFWIDFVVLSPLILLAYFLGEKSRLLQVYWLVPGLLFGIWFHIYLVVRYGGTPGKVWLGMRVAMTDGSSVTARAATLRYSVLLVLSELQVIGLAIAATRMSDAEYFGLSYVERSRRLVELAPDWYQVVSVLVTVWVWSEFITMLFNKKRRAVHDFMAGTVVLIKPKKAEGAAPISLPASGSTVRR